MADNAKVQAEKKELRKRMFQIRRNAFDLHKQAGQLMSVLGIDLMKELKNNGAVQIKKESIIAGYYPIRTEIDDTKLLKDLEKHEYRICLPVIEEQEKPLIFRSYTQESELIKGEYGILHPTEDSQIVEPDIVFVPLLAFDSKGYRLGYGGGFYDRTLAKLRRKKPIWAIGLAFLEQYIERVPINAYDVPLDAVLTPQKLFHITG